MDRETSGGGGVARRRRRNIIANWVENASERGSRPTLAAACCVGSTNYATLGPDSSQRSTAKNSVIAVVVTADKHRRRRRCRPATGTRISTKSH